MPDAPIESHAAHSERLIFHAELELAQGDRLQASEKAWGYVAHRIKHIAQRRNWKYTNHSHVFAIMDQLVAETGDPELDGLFSFANNLHRNFYADEKPIAQVEYEIGMVKRLLAKLSQIE